MSDDEGVEEEYTRGGDTYAGYPESLRSLRACLRCKLIKSAGQFQDNGCDNCVEFEEKNPIEYTTPRFHGMLAMLNSSESWVARWQKQVGRQRGLYALQVVGDLQTVEGEEEDEDM